MAENREQLRRQKSDLKKQFSRVDYLWDDDQDDDEYYEELGVIITDENIRKIEKSSLKKRLWDLLERPDKTLLGRFFRLICLCTIIFSIFLICAESVYEGNLKETQKNLVGLKPSKRQVLYYFFII